MTEPNPEHCFKILVATDIHLGYNEKDAIRGNDSFVTFEEILSHAKNQQVDFILLGGDLFHDANPSQNSLQKCLQLLRQYTLGDAPIMFEFLSDQSVNYEDPNMNIAIPVFSIHGNHDDPSGFGGLSSMDLISTTGLLNYFGRCEDLTEVHIKPIFMKKGSTQLALYGLSHIHDNRLSRLFRDSKVIMEQPDEKSGEWFNMMVLHQNRADRGPKNYVPEEILPEFLDLVLWGHEHDCRVWPEKIPEKNFYVTQPGSSVATSLSEGESIDKHIAVLYICENQFKLEPIKLQTVRPFVFKSINLDDYEDELGLDEGDVVPKVKALASKMIEEMIEEAKLKESGNPAQQTKPLIRLRIMYKEEVHVFNTIRFGQLYNEQVANSSDMVHMQRSVKRAKVEKKSIDESAMNNAFKGRSQRLNDGDDEVQIEDYVDHYFSDPTNLGKLEVLFSSCLSEMCHRLANSNDVDAATKIIEFSKEKACQFLNEKMPTFEDIDEVLSDFRTLKCDEVYNEMGAILSKRRTAATVSNIAMNVDNANNDRNNENENPLNVAQSSKAAKTSTARQPKANAAVVAASTSAASTSAASTSAASTSAASTSAASASTASTLRKGKAANKTPATSKKARAAANKTPLKKELNISTTRKNQPTIQQSLSTRSTRQNKPAIVYDISD